AAGEGGRQGARRLRPRGGEGPQPPEPRRAALAGPLPGRLDALHAGEAEEALPPRGPRARVRARSLEGGEGDPGAGRRALAVGAAVSRSADLPAPRYPDQGRQDEHGPLPRGP